MTDEDGTDGEPPATADPDAATADPDAATDGTDAATTDERVTTGDGSVPTTDDSLGPSVDRRRLLRAGLNVGVGAALVLGFGTEYVSSNDRDTITYALARPEPGEGTLAPRTKEVPVAWRESLRLAFAAQEELYDAGLSSVLGSFVVPGTYDDPDARLSVDVVDEGDLERLRELAGGLTLDVSLLDGVPEAPAGEFALGDAYQLPDPDAERVPGGVACKGRQYGTLAPALFEAGRSRRYFATSNHVYGRGGARTTGHRGERLSLFHADRARTIGTVVRGHPEVDLVRAAPVAERRPVPTVDRAAPSGVVGQYTLAGLADLMAREEHLAKVGAFSDRTTGRIKGVSGVTCYTGKVCKRGQLKWGDEESIQDGDSGSVTFHADPENPGSHVLVGGMNNARTWWPGRNFAWGTAGHYLLDAYGLHF